MRPRTNQKEIVLSPDDTKKGRIQIKTFFNTNIQGIYL